VSSPEVSGDAGSEEESLAGSQGLPPDEESVAQKQV